jgi:hypothetical protein
MGMRGPFGFAVEISRERPFAPARRSSEDGGSASAAARRGGRAAPAASAAASRSRPNRTPHPTSWHHIRRSIRCIRRRGSWNFPSSCPHAMSTCTTDRARLVRNGIRAKMPGARRPSRNPCRLRLGGPHWPFSAVSLHTSSSRYSVPVNFSVIPRKGRPRAGTSCNSPKIRRHRLSNFHPRWHHARSSRSAN